MSEHLTSHHRATLHKIFDHGGGAHNVEWREVISLLEAVGKVEEEHNGKFKVMLGDSLVFLHRPKHKDVDTQPESVGRSWMMGVRAASKMGFEAHRMVIHGEAPNPILRRRFARPAPRDSTDSGSDAGGHPQGPGQRGLQPGHPGL